MDRHELIDLVEKIKSCQCSEQETDRMIEQLEKNTADPYISDYIFYDELTAEEIIDKALNYKPIIL